MYLSTTPTYEPKDLISKALSASLSTKWCNCGIEVKMKGSDVRLPGLKPPLHPLVII